MIRIWKVEGPFWFDLFRLACHGLTIAIFFGFLGALIPVGDSLAVFRIEFTVLLAVFGVIAYCFGRTLITMTATVAVCVSVLSLLPFVGEDAPVARPDFRLHQHNILYGNKRMDELIAQIRATDADILTLQEISEVNFAQLKTGLGDEYPHYQVCLYSHGGVAVMMRDLGALLEYGCVKKSRLAWMRVETALGPITVGSIHQLWPWPNAQFWQRDLFVSDIVVLERPVILGGDFNNVPWASSVQSTANAAGGRLPRGLARSYVFDHPWPRFRIDHVIAPLDADISARITPGWGSDHLGVTADIRLNQSRGTRD